jgi:hypothetical protein
MSTCVSCGCDDLHACVAAGGEPCYWLVEFDDGTGICSACPEAFDEAAADEAEWPEESRPSSGLILPGDEEFDRTVCGLRRR